MSTAATAYDNIKISPYQLSHLQKLTITQAVNEHARLRLTGIVPEEQKDSYVAATEAGTSIQVSQTAEDGSETVLFHGKVLHIEVKAVRDIYYLEVEAVSPTYDMDLKLHSRSFQNKGMAFSALLQQVMSAYGGSDGVDLASGGASIGGFTIQYQETDWQFLMRMASRYQAGLLPSASQGTAKLTVGVSEGDDRGQLENFHYRASKRIADYRIAAQNGGYDVDENDFIDYEVETYQALELGSRITFKGRSLFVREAYTEMADGLLKHRYRFCSKKGLVSRRLYNEKLIGASVSGRVIAVSRDQVQIHLDIDKSQSKQEACWFPYSSVYTAEGNSGWYCMPEIGDVVRLYFPGRKEEEGIAISSVRQDSEEGETNKLGNPDIKYFRTASGKELMMSPSEIVITGKDGEVFIRLNDSDGIEIFSKKEIKLISKEDITMNSEKKIVISAKEEISMSCKESNLKMDGSTILSGQETKTN
ncbi:contractile injection system protein, VgrG/Pvc8 family [Paenibacillus turpanensis]|uniref:contractile injection system protein, VgrG/Pvc8 family n=1 Tax=Paenibacillus turpanensis TaxID=2689078 RepID=UPI00140A0A1A|nr:contractile injection system protein, VgrG/Pvc8 family [Paenibacillus turpanensis]